MLLVSLQGSDNTITTVLYWGSDSFFFGLTHSSPPFVRKMMALSWSVRSTAVLQLLVESWKNPHYDESSDSLLSLLSSLVRT